MGQDSVPPIHDAIYNHSRRSPHSHYVWIMKTSVVDENGNLGFPATIEEIRRYGEKARKVFWRKTPSALQKSFVEAVMSWEDEHPRRRPWKKREADSGGFGDERDTGYKRQQGMEALEGNSEDQGRAGHGATMGGRNPIGARQAQGHHRHGCGGDNRYAQLRLQEQKGKRQVTNAQRPTELHDKLNSAKDKRGAGEK
jgi:hypothetical protein